MSCQHLDGFAGKSRMCLPGVSSCSLQEKYGVDDFFQIRLVVCLRVFFICFPVTARFLPPDWQLQPGSGPQPPPPQRAIFCQAVMGGRELGRTCHPLSSRTIPRAEAGAGEAAVTGPSAGVKPVTPSSGQGDVEPLHGWVSAQLGALYKQSQKSYFLGYGGSDHLHSPYCHSSSVSCLPLP